MKLKKGWHELLRKKRKLSPLALALRSLRDERSVLVVRFDVSIRQRTIKIIVTKTLQCFGDVPLAAYQNKNFHGGEQVEAAELAY